MNRWLTRGIALLSCLMLSACSVTRANLSEEFDRSVKSYNQMLRWHEIEKAGTTYFAPELRDQFLKQAESLKKQGLTIADVRIVTSKCLPENNSGNVIAEFDYYTMPSNKIKTVSYHQQWAYRENIRSWILTSGLSVFE